MSDLLVQLDKELPAGSEITLFNGRQGIMGKCRWSCFAFSAKSSESWIRRASLAPMYV